MYRMIEKKMIGLLLITAVINGMAYGQQDKTFIIFPEVRTLYTEFDNLVRIHSENRKIKLACTGCDTIYRLSDNKNEWIVRIDQQKTATFIVTDKKERILHKEMIHVIPVPTPSVYLDGIDAQSVLSKMPSIIDLKLDESVPLNVQFLIMHWQININEQAFKGSGRAISEEVKTYIKHTKSGIIHLTITYYDPTGKHEMNDFFAFKLERD